MPGRPPVCSLTGHRPDGKHTKRKLPACFRRHDSETSRSIGPHAEHRGWHKFRRETTLFRWYRLVIIRIHHTRRSHSIPFHRLPSRWADPPLEGRRLFLSGVTLSATSTRSSTRWLSLPPAPSPWLVKYPTKNDYHALNGFGGENIIHACGGTIGDAVGQHDMVGGIGPWVTPRDTDLLFASGRSSPADPAQRTDRS